MSREAGKRTAWRAVAFFLLPCLLLATGCQTTSTQYLQAELRNRDRELRDLREKLAWRDALQQQQQAADHQQVGYTPAAEASLQSIVLGRGTGGIDADHRAGDEALRVVIEPRDRDGKPVKAPGTVHVASLLIEPNGQERPLCSWDVPAEKLRAGWRYGVQGTGYYLILPWKSWPDSDRVRVVAQFTLPGGRIVEAVRTITVRVTPGAYRKTVAAKPAPVRSPLPSPPLPADGNVPPAIFPVAARWAPTGSERYLSDCVQLGRPEDLVHPMYSN